MRTRPAHTRAAMAARQVPPMAHPAANGSASDSALSAGKAAETARMTRSAIMSGAYRSGGLGSSRTSHPMWA
jgi:hypothetical protein